MQRHLNVLVIEDDPDGRRSVTDALELSGCEVTAVETGTAGLTCLREATFDVLLSDVRLPDMDGLKVLAQARQDYPKLPVLLMTAYGTVATAVAALKSGAYDYILKPLDLTDLQTKIARAAETTQLRAEVTRLRTALSDRAGTRALVWQSEAMRNVLERVQAVASTKATVLVSGESGVGKELIARELHFSGDRATAPFVAVNCGAFAETLLESELFGHEKGAFTGATGRHLGAFERAQDGTLFLDEISIAPARVQERLLRVLEEKEITRVGGSGAVALNVRIVAASNQDLHQLARERVFRQDLLYRLQVVTIHVPPLRERIADIRPLADHFIAMACAEYGRQIEHVAPDYYTRLEQHNWHGNVRELKHAVEVSVLMADTKELNTDNLQLDALAAPQPSELPAAGTLAEIERAALMRALTRHQGQRTATATELDVSVRTIQRKIREYNLPY